MLYDLQQKLPGATLAGVDISEYAVKNSLPEMRQNIHVGNAKSLPFDSSSFDVVIAINTIHNLEVDECALALEEITRVSREAFVTVDAYRNEEEKTYGCLEFDCKNYHECRRLEKFFQKSQLHRGLLLVHSLENKVMQKVYQQMFLIRFTEMTIADKYPEGEMRCPTHLSIGQELVPSVISQHITKKTMQLALIGDMLTISPKVVT